MDITINLNKDFERCLDELRNKYGTDFEYINGVHPSQLDYSEFLDKFVKQDTLADATIDPNANANHRDIRSFVTEKGKAEDKLFALSKIFYEIKKQWGLRTAKDWFIQEYSRGFYLNDSTSSSYYPYCYHKSGMITVKYKGAVSVVSFSQLYDMVEEKEEILNSDDDAFVKYTKDLMVLDVVDGNQVFTNVSRVVKHRRTNNLQYVKVSNGLDQIITEDHQMITSFGEKASKDLIIENDALTTVCVDYSKYLDMNKQEIYIASALNNINKDLYINGAIVTESTSKLEEPVVYICNHDTPHSSKFRSKKSQPFLNNKLVLSKELGYLIGMIVTDGTYAHDIVTITQNKGLIYDRIIECCKACQLPYKEYAPNKIRIGNTLFTEVLTRCFLKKATSTEKEFLPVIFSYNKEFLLGVLGGIIDGDGCFPKYWDNMCSYTGNSSILRNQIAQLCMIFNFKPRCQIKYSNKGFMGKILNHKNTLYGVDFRIFKDGISIWSIKIENTIKNLLSESKSDAAIRKPYTTSYGIKEVVVSSKFDCNDNIVYDITTDTHHFICNNILSHNCWANDLTRLAKEGLFFLNGYNAQGPKHLTTYFDDVIEFTSFLSNRQSGAVGLPNVIIWAYYFWKHDVENGYYLKDPDTYLRQNFQKFIYRLNQPFMRIDQCAFTNVSIFDRKYLESLFGGVEFPDGTFAIDQIEEIIKVQKVFMEVVSETRTQQMFTFPVLTYSLLYKDGKFVDEDFARWASKHNIKWSDSNFFVSDNVGVLSNCCRLLSETKELDPFINSIGGTALSVGSCRVSTINLVRIAYEVLDLTKDLDDKAKLKAKEKYIKLLKDRVELDCKALYTMRRIIQRNIEKGLLPNYQEGALELDKQFCTIGGIGLYEVMDLFGLINTDEFGYKTYSDEAMEFAVQILDTMNEVKDNFTKEQNCNFKYNIEFVPAENAAGVLCTADNLLFEQNKYFIYSNQWINLMEKCSIQEKCRLGSIFDKKCGGGAIAHINIENRFPDEEAAWDMLNYIAQQGVIYFAFNPKISVCEDKHAFIGAKTCPICNKPVADTFTRVVGFLVPSKSFQKIRKREFEKRKWYNVLNKNEVM